MGEELFSFPMQSDIKDELTNFTKNYEIVPMTITRGAEKDKVIGRKVDGGMDVE